MKKFVAILTALMFALSLSVAVAEEGKPAPDKEKKEMTKKEKKAKKKKDKKDKKAETPAAAPGAAK